MSRRILRWVGFLLWLLVPALAWADGAALLDEQAVAAKLATVTDYQLLDARGSEAQRLAPLPFSTRYQQGTSVKQGVVFIVADDDASALKIAAAIPTESRAVYAVKGGAGSWQRAMNQLPSPSSVSKSFVIPKNTCEQGKPLAELKREKPLQQFHPQ